MYSILNTLLALLVVTAIIRSLSNYRRLGTAVPGPFLAGITDLWRAYHQYTGQLRTKLIELHAQHGPVVRYGVNSVSIADPQVIKLVYGSGRYYEFTTAESYGVLIGIQNGKEVPSLVSTADEGRHGALRRSVAGAFTTGAVRGYEGAMDVTISELLGVLESSEGEGEGGIDLSSTMLYLTMDTAGRFTFGESLGCLSARADVGGSIALIRSRFDHWGRWSSLPGLERVVYRNPFAMWRSRQQQQQQQQKGKAASSRMAALAVEKIQSRRLSGTCTTTTAATANGEGKGDDGSNNNNNNKEEEKDLLQRFLEASKEHPETLDTPGVVGMLMSTISGAGDTTATTMVAALYYLMRHPSCMAKLRAELLLDAANQETRNPNSPPDYATLSRLPYLQAVIRESMRLFPTPTWPIERVVPCVPGGLQIEVVPGSCQTVDMPPGTSVGCLPSVVHMDKGVFGEDVGVYRPERWLPSDEEDKRESEKDRIRMMEATHMGFSRGRRSCLGQNVAVMQMKKVIAAVVMRFDLSLVDENAQLEADFSPAVACLKPLHVRRKIRQ